MADRPLRLLVATDFSKDSRRALRAARKLMERTGGALTILHVRPSSDVRAAVLEERGDLLRSPVAGLKKALEEHYHRKLSAFTGGRSGERWVVAKGRTALEIVREARRGYDLLFSGTRGRGAAARLLLGSTVQELLQRSPIPVVVVPAK